MNKINWQKVVTREYSFLWASYTAEAYKKMLKITGTTLNFNLFYTEGRILTIYREPKDVLKSYKLINSLLKKDFDIVVGYIDEYESLLNKIYVLFEEIKRIRNKREVCKKLIELDKIFLKIVCFFLFFVFLGYAGDLPNVKKFLKKHGAKIKKIRMKTIDTDISKEFPLVFNCFDERFKSNILYMTRKEVINVLYDKQANWQKIEKRKQKGLLVVRKNIVKEVELDKIDKTLTTELSHLKINKDRAFLKGRIACQGKISGKVVIVLKKSDYKKIFSGCILVTPMTKPDIIPYLKNVKGIITNDGGALCHASIISRELSIPCVVGTIYATDILKDGENVFLDASQGIIKRDIKN